MLTMNDCLSQTERGISWHSVSRLRVVSTRDGSISVFIDAVFVYTLQLMVMCIENLVLSVE